MKFYKHWYIFQLVFLLLLSIAILDHSKLSAQENTKSIEHYESRLVRLADSLLYNSPPMDKPAINEMFVKTLRETLEMPDSYLYPFENLSKIIHIIKAEDNSFKIFNWVVVISSFQRRYYGAIQMNSKNLELFPLFDMSDKLENENRALNQVSNREWYGCEYYNIKTQITSTGKKIYNLFGHNNNAYQSRKKIVDILTFKENKPVFGLPIIHTPQGTINRLIVEYKKDAYVNLNYNEEEKKIIFDRLISEIGDPEKRFTYVPSGQMDGFIWENDSWNFVPNAIKVMKLQDGQAPIDGVFPE